MTIRIDQHSPSRPKFVKAATMDDLKRREIFEDVDDYALKEILKHSTIRKLDAGRSLHPTIHQESYVYVILSGYVAIWSKSEFTDKEENFLAWRGPEQVIGEMRSVGSGPTASQIVACEVCKFIEIRNDVFTDVANGSPRIYRNIGLLLIKKMAHEACRSEIIRMSPASRQVAQTILHLAHERAGYNQLDKSEPIIIPGIIHQSEICGYIGIKRENVSRELASLKKKNIIAYDKNRNGSRITILDSEALKKIARSPTPRRKRKNE